jgi:hypothetical protein
VHDHLLHRGGMVFEDLGEQLVKNIAHPIRAFRLRSGDAASQQEVSTPEETAEARALNRRSPGRPPETRCPRARALGQRQGGQPWSSNPTSSSTGGTSPRSPEHGLMRPRFRLRTL